MIFTLALCALGIAVAGSRLNVFAEAPSTDQRVQTAWQSNEKRKNDDGSVDIEASAEAAAEFRAALNRTVEKEPHEIASSPSDPEGQFQRALGFADVKSAAFDMAQAEDWFKRAAEQGHIRAAKRLGDIYRYGSPKDIDRALYWYGYPKTHFITTGKLVGGTEEDLGALQKAETALLVEKNPPKSSDTAKPMTAYETGEAIGAALKYMTGNAAPSQQAENPVQQSDPKVAACRAEALKHITTCKKGTDILSCETWGCSEIVRCDGYAKACERHGSPYNSDEQFYCDKRNWRTRDFELENVLRSACPAQ